MPRRAKTGTIERQARRFRRVAVLAKPGNREGRRIASDLGIHERTVKLHRTAITTKLRLHSVAELTRLWLEIHGDTDSGDRAQGL